MGLCRPGVLTMIKCAQINGVAVETEDFTLTAQALLERAARQGAFPEGCDYREYALQGFYSAHKYAPGEMIYLTQEAKFLTISDGPATAQ